MTRYKQRNFYTDDQAFGVKKLYSYSTLVGFQVNNDVFFTKQKYSSTTSKQCTMYANENNLKRHNIDINTFNTLKNETRLVDLITKLAEEI